MINEDSIDESVGAHPTYIHYSELDDVKYQRDMWQETAEAYKFLNTQLIHELSKIKDLNKKCQELLNLFESYYVCEDCHEKAGTALIGCSNPLHKIHDYLYIYQDN
jgi:hypothetical protein